MEDEDEIQNIEAEDVGGQMLKETELQNDGEHEEQDGANKELMWKIRRTWKRKQRKEKWRKEHGHHWKQHKGH